MSRIASLGRETIVSYIHLGLALREDGGEAGQTDLQSHHELSGEG